MKKDWIVLNAAIISSIALAQPTLEKAQALRSAGQQKEALQLFEHLVTIEPKNASFHFEYGSFLSDLDQKELYEKAFYHLKQATELQNNAQWLFKLGCFTCRIGKFKESIAAYQNILKRHPNQISVLYNLGFTLKTCGQLDAAIVVYKKVLTLNPDYEPAHLGLAFAYITKNEFKTGWKEHEWNLKYQGKNGDDLRTLLRTNTVAGKRILLRPEGGLGDSINFVRYVQRLKHMGAYTIVAIQSALSPLLSGCPYIDMLIPSGTRPIPPHDASATLMSLPAIFADDEKTIPQNIPYLFPDPELISYWHERLKQDTHFKIGICWQPDVHNDVSRLPIARRGIPLSYFFTLGENPGISLYSLQQKEGLDQLKDLPEHITIHTFDEAFDKTHGSFMDTAAVMHEMDLIISTDTATAHLAGAMGKRVWLLLPYATDWRWGWGQMDTVWYPTMKLFKQTEPFNWNKIIEKMHSIFFKELYHH